MRKLFVFIAVLAAAAACGGSTGSGSTATSNDHQAGPYAQTGSAASQPSKFAAQPDATSRGATPLPGTTVPTLQGPPVIRQAQLNLTVGSGLFDSKLAQVRTLVESEGGYIAGTDAQAGPNNDTQNSQIRTGVISFMVPAAHFDDTID